MWLWCKLHSLLAQSLVGCICVCVVKSCWYSGTSNHLCWSCISYYFFSFSNACKSSSVLSACYSSRLDGIIKIQRCIVSVSQSVLPSVFWHCWVGMRKSIQPVKLSDKMLMWLSVWREVQIIWIICTWSSCCHCHPVVSCFIKIQIGLTFLVLAFLAGCPVKGR